MRLDAVRTRHDVEGEREVAGAARKRADDRDVGRREHAGLGVAPRRQHPPGRLVAVDAAVVGGVADGAADVASRLESGEPRGERRGRSARGPAGDKLEIPGVVGGAVDRVVALEVGQVVRDVGLAKDDRPGREEPVHGHRVRRRDVVAKLRHTPGGGKSLDVVGVLDGHRHAVKGSPDLSAGERGVRLAGAGAGPIEVEHHDGVEIGVEALDPDDVVVQQLEAADPPLPDLRGEARCALKGRFHTACLLGLYSFGWRARLRRAGAGRCPRRLRPEPTPVAFIRA